MATLDTGEKEFLECGLCFENDELKRLPCNPNHIYCTTCLTKDSELTKIIKCPQCRTVFDEGIDDIPSAGAPLDKFLCCDVCMRKDDRRRLAQIYCVICQKKFCTPHEKSHNDALDDHRRIRMDEYKRDYRKLETRYCEKHPKHVYSLACSKCATVFCANCMGKIDSCSDGGGHDLMAVEDTVRLLTDLLNEKKVWIYDKEEHLLGMSKQLAAIISDWDTETQQMIDKLYRARDGQIKELTKRYAELEEKLVELRNLSRAEVTSFLDDEIGNRLDKLSRQVARIDKRLYTYHEVDVAGGYTETQKMIEELMNMKIPEYKPSSNHVCLSEIDCGDLKLAVHISQLSEKQLNLPTLASPAVPTSMKLVKTFKFRSVPYSVTKHGDVIFAGLSNGEILQCSDKATGQSIFVDTGSLISGLRVYNDELYVLLERASKVNVYHVTTRQLLRSWTHDSSGRDINKLRVLNNKVIIPNRRLPSLTVYSLQGELIKQITIPFMSTGSKALAVCGDNSVILSDYEANSVSRINIDSGEVVWTSKHVRKPQGVVCYGNRYVMVTNANTDTRIWILDIHTGECVGEICGQNWRIRSHNDLDIVDDTLILTSCNPDVIQTYQLITD